MLNADSRERYARHILLDEVGSAGQQRLVESSVLVIGAGGLGSPVLLYLAAAGVGRIGIVDFDEVDVSNLQRQVLHGTSDVGRRKVDSARDRLAELNPLIDIETYAEAITTDNALDLLATYDVVIDGSDNFPTRYLVNDACELLGKPLVYGSILRFEGQVSVFHHEGGPSYRDLYPTPPAEGTMPSCGEAGVLGILPGIIGTLQATEAVKILLGLGETLSGRLLLYDARSLTFRELRLSADPRRTPVTELTDLTFHCGEPMSNVPFERIDVQTAKTKMDGGWKPYVLDVRKPAEAEISKFDFMDRLHPHETVVSIIDELPRDRDILVTCRSGGRSAMAASMLAEHGFTRLFNLEGGINGWASQIDTSMTVY